MRVLLPGFGRLGSLRAAFFMPKQRVIVYIDGFNLYYGAVKDTTHKWLNIEKYFERLRVDDDVREIKYFTALVIGADQLERQKTYLAALESLSKVRIILGKFKTTQTTCRVRDCQHPQKRFARPEEKRTDVAIGIELLDDAYQDAFDTAVVVSGDSDLVPATHRVKQRFPNKRIFVYVPARSFERGAAIELRKSADKDRTLPLGLLPTCQFPREVITGPGSNVSKPQGW